MRRHSGTALLMLAALAGCTGQPPTPPPTPTTPPSINTVVAQPKHVDETTRCADFISIDEVNAATGTTAAAKDEAGYTCRYSLTKRDGKSGGELWIALGGLAGPLKGLPVVVTTVSGNTAVEQQSPPSDCNFWIVIDGNRPPDGWGAVLWVRTSFSFLDVDACRVARELAEKSFARLPDA